jgi:hypothetical protein
MNKTKLNYWKKELKSTILAYYDMFDDEYPVEKSYKYKQEIRALNEIVKLAKFSLEMGFEDIVEYRARNLCDANLELMISEEKLNQARKKAEYIKNGKEGK